jgi:uncharacterized membrane protein YdcZ (DUF606 family)
MIVLPVLFTVVGFLIAVTFAFDVAKVASSLAGWHSRNALRFPRYYRFTDPWSLSRKEAWWRLYGGVFGTIFFIAGTATLFAAAGLIGK